MCSKKSANRKKLLKNESLQSSVCETQTRLFRLSSICVQSMRNGELRWSTSTTHNTQRHTYIRTQIHKAHMSMCWSIKQQSKRANNEITKVKLNKKKNKEKNTHKNVYHLILGKVGCLFFKWPLHVTQKTIRLFTIMSWSQFVNKKFKCILQFVLVRMHWAAKGNRDNFSCDSFIERPVPVHNNISYLYLMVEFNIFYFIRAFYPLEFPILVQFSWHFRGFEYFIFFILCASRAFSFQTAHFPIYSSGHIFHHYLHFFCQRSFFIFNGIIQCFCTLITELKMVS